MYSPVLCCVDVDAQPIANSIEAAMKIAKNRFGRITIDLPKLVV